MDPNPQSSTCPKCGTVGTGKFCHECGAAIRDQQCPHCSAALSNGARYCHECGEAVDTRSAETQTSAKLPWVVAGIAVVATVLALVVRSQPSVPTDSQTATGAPANLGPPDISNMTPLERADGLFEVVMIALERGDTAQVGFHAPMALAAYRSLDSLDADAQYHVGLLRGAIGDYDGMVAMADTLQMAVPGHLLATTLRKAAAEAMGDSVAVYEAYHSFLSDYSTEATKDRREYLLHQRSIEAFLLEARRATAGEGS